MKNMTALLAATKAGHKETIFRLLEHPNIDIKVQDKVCELIEVLFGKYSHVLIVK